MQITDEMVREASKAYNDYVIGCPTQAYLPHAMRAALEAALGARSEKVGKFVKELKDSAYWQSNEDYAKAAACIEDIAEALKSCEAWIDRWTDHVGHCDGGDKGTCGRTAILYEVRIALERWGLK